MIPAEDNSFDRAIDPYLEALFSAESARAIAEYQADESLRHRIDQLAMKCNEAELTADERAEYAGYVHANNFVAILQAKARRFLSEQPT